MKLVSALAVFGAAAASAAPLRLPLRAGSLDRPIFAGSPLSLDVGGSQQFIPNPNVTLTGDWDAVSLDMTPYGIPYSAFVYEEPQPVSWAARLAATLEAITGSWQLPVVLQLPVTQGSCPPQNASDGAGGAPSVNDFTGCSACFDYDEVTNPIAAFIKQGIINYQLYVAISVNLTGGLGLLQMGVDANAYFADNCGAAKDAAYVAFLGQLYDTLKQPFPQIGIFPSFSLEVMMQARDGMDCAGQLAAGTAKPPATLAACTRAGYAQLAGIPRDAFAFSATPAASLLGATTPGFRPWYVSLPLSVLAGGDTAIPVLVSSTAMPTGAIQLNFGNSTVGAAAAAVAAADPNTQCGPIFASNATYAASWLSTLLAALPVGRTLLVSWTAARDVLFPQAMACPCSAPLPVLEPYCDTIALYRQLCRLSNILPAACELQIKLRGQLGVRDLFGAPVQPLYDVLQAARSA